ncbi:MAG: helix-turn-helix domain-containing protein [Devosia sp.]|nr:helix-turn-helix domain-containing protein [Devosia sp.]
MNDDTAGLSDLAELILAVGRLIQPGDQAIGACTPIESSVMRFISRNPGTSARAASEATLLTSSNFSRVLRGLEEKGLVSREPDASDARRVSLYPTALAHESRRRLGEEWDRLLGGIEDDPAKIHHLTSTLRRIEGELVSRRGRENARRPGQE